MHLKFRNVNDAFRGLVSGFHTGKILTNVVPSRYGEVMRVEEPVTITYEYPRERVLFNAARDCNPFFHLFESLWMLAGRNDIAPLAYYSSQISKFSDDGVTQHDAYGYRWRHWFGWDQLKGIVDELRKNPTSRRCVLQMWDATAAYSVLNGEECNDFYVATHGGKAVPCLAGGTRFRSPEGDLSIAELSSKFQSCKNFKYPVYSVDITTGDQRLTWMTNAWKSGNKVVYRVKFDDGSSLKLTGDHILYKKTRVYEGTTCVGLSVQESRVCDLSVGDRVLAEVSEAAQSRLSPGGYRQFRRSLYSSHAGNGPRRQYIFEHREYVSLVEKLMSDHDVHHINGNKLDNRLDNLLQLPHGDHAKLGKFGDNNPHNKMSPEDKAKRGRKHSIAIKRYWDSLTPELRRAYATNKKNRTAQQWDLIQDYQSSKTNHKIISIERVGVAPVYDFTVPHRHNAVLSNGVVCHNCNTQAYFEVEDEQFLNMTVCNRSNDLILGMLGANVVHFSFLQEYLACCIGLQVGKYHQFTNNLHAYTENWYAEKWLSVVNEDTATMYDPVPYDYATSKEDKESNGGALPGRLMFDTSKGSTNLTVDIFDTDLYEFIDDPFKDWASDFLRTVAKPMMQAFKHHKARHYDLAYEAMGRVQADDWNWAGMQWLQKRQVGWDRKNAIAANKAKEEKEIVE